LQVLLEGMMVFFRELESWMLKKIAFNVSVPDVRKCVRNGISEASQEVIFFPRVRPMEAPNEEVSVRGRE
jgi:hypothetical protein